MGLTKPRAAQIFNLDYKQATRVVTVSNVTLSGGAPSVVDGVSLSLNDRVLVTGQTTGSQNGLYYVTTVGSGANGTWARTTDGNDNGEIETGMIVMVTEGSIYADTQWKLITDGIITLDVTALTFTQNYSANSISGGTSNVTVYSNANITVSSAGTANVLTVSSTGTSIKGNETITYTPATTTGSAILAQGANTQGGTGYFDFLKATNQSSGATNSSKTIRLNSTGNIEIINSAYSQNLFSLTDSGNVTVPGNISASYFIGNGSALTGIQASTGSYIVNGTSNVSVAPSSNTTIVVAGTTVATFASTGVYLPGVLSATGNITGSYIIGNGSQLTGLPAGYTNANLASLGSNVISTTGTITGGNITGGNILTGGIVSATGNVTGGNVSTGGNVAGTWMLPTTGVSTGGNILVGGYISVVGNLYVSNVVSSGNLTVTDPLVYFINTSTYPYNYDIGFYSAFTGGTGNTYQHTGVVRDYVDNTWKIASNIPEPAGTTLDFTNAIYDPLKTGSHAVVGNITATTTISATGNVTGGNILANGYYYANGTPFTSGPAYTRSSFTATASQTTFTVTYTVGLIQVYVNGVLLNASDYTASNGTSVVLAVACNLGDIVETIAFTSTAVTATVPAFSYYANTSQSITSGVSTKVAINTLVFDTTSNFSTTNNRYQPTVAGYYQINGTVRCTVSGSSGTLFSAYIWKNGAVYAEGAQIQGSGLLNSHVTVSEVVYLNGSTDYVELYGLVSGTTPGFNYFSNDTTSRFSGCLLRTG